MRREKCSKKKETRERELYLLFVARFVLFSPAQSGSEKNKLGAAAGGSDPSLGFRLLGNHESRLPIDRRVCLMLRLLCD
jgi:hypothetical protein